VEPLAKVRDGYDRWAKVYDDDQNPLQALEGPLVQQACGNVQGLRVLDMGCGTGCHALWLAQAGAKVTGIDFSKARYPKDILGWADPDRLAEVRPVLGVE